MTLFSWKNCCKVSCIMLPNWDRRKHPMVSNFCSTIWLRDIVASYWDVWLFYQLKFSADFMLQLRQLLHVWLRLAHVARCMIVCTNLMTWKVFFSIEMCIHVILLMFDFVEWLTLIWRTRQIRCNKYWPPCDIYVCLCTFMWRGHYIKLESGFDMW